MKNSILNQVKKYISVIVAIVLVFSFAACSLPSAVSRVMDIDDFDKDKSDWVDFWDKDGKEESKTSEAEEKKEEEIADEGNLLKLLLIGVDSRDDDFSGRSDTMILVTINKDTKKVVLTSLLRDIYVDIPEHGSNRLNAATVYGGSKLLKDTIDANFGIKVRDSITFNFCSVREIVDYLGGIDMELTADEIEIMNGYLVSQNDNFGYAPGTDIMEAADGTYHLNGNQTLAYCRIRYIGTDFMRTERQRTVIKKCVEKIKKFDIVEMAEMAGILYKNTDSNIVLTDGISLLSTVVGLTDYEVSTFTIPMEGTWHDATIDGMAVLDIDFEANHKEWLKRVTE